MRHKARTYGSATWPTSSTPKTSSSPIGCCAWLHTLRDRLTVEASAHFAAQLPDLIRGVYYAGWNPSAVPQKYDVEEYALRFAHEATIAPADVGKAAAATTAATLHHLPAAQMDKALEQLPQQLRAVLQPGQ